MSMICLHISLLKVGCIAFRVYKYGGAEGVLNPYSTYVPSYSRGLYGLSGYCQARDRIVGAGEPPKSNHTCIYL
jgi:hypothetical protein